MHVLQTRVNREFAAVRSEVGVCLNTRIVAERVDEVNIKLIVIVELIVDAPDVLVYTLIALHDI
jgi:hypothetical protein